MDNYNGTYERINTEKMFEDWQAQQFMNELEENNYTSPNAGLIVDCIDWNHWYTQDEIVEMTRELNRYERNILSTVIELNNNKIKELHPEEVEFNKAKKEAYIHNIRQFINDNKKHPEIYVLNEKIRDLGQKWLDEYDEAAAKGSRRKKFIINATHQKLAKYNLKIGQEFESRKALYEYCGINPKQASQWAKKGWIREG